MRPPYRHAKGHSQYGKEIPEKKHALSDFPLLLQVNFKNAEILQMYGLFLFTP